jgi:hypothetical protein
VGAESTGKTSLAAALCRALAAQGHDVVQVPEYLREFCNLHGRTPLAGEQRSKQCLIRDIEDRRGPTDRQSQRQDDRCRETRTTRQRASRRARFLEELFQPQHPRMIPKSARRSYQIVAAHSDWNGRISEGGCEPFRPTGSPPAAKCDLPAPQTAGTGRAEKFGLRPAKAASHLTQQQRQRECRCSRALPP